jgi:hypothetical protein
VLDRTTIADSLSSSLLDGEADNRSREMARL